MFLFSTAFLDISASYRLYIKRTFLKILWEPCSFSNQQLAHLTKSEFPNTLRGELESMEYNSPPPPQDKQVDKVLTLVYLSEREWGTLISAFFSLLMKILNILYMKIGIECVRYSTEDSDGFQHNLVLSYLHSCAFLLHEAKHLVIIALCLVRFYYILYINWNLLLLCTALNLDFWGRAG